MKHILLVLPDLGGLGKSTISEMLMTLFELNGKKVIGIDGDPTAKGLHARRGGWVDNILVLIWPTGVQSKATAIINAVDDGGIGLVDFGAGTLDSLSVDATVRDLLTNKDAGVRVTCLLIGEASKPGNANAIFRIRKAYPDADCVFVKNAKSGSDWSMFEDACAGMDVLFVPGIPSAITSWLATYESGRFDDQRLALTEVITNPAPEYTIVSDFFAAQLHRLGEQKALRQRFGNLEDFKAGNDDLGRIVLDESDLRDPPMTLFLAQSRAVEKFLEAPLPHDDAEMIDFIAKFGSVGLEHVKAREARQR